MSELEITWEIHICRDPVFLGSVDVQRSYSDPVFLGSVYRGDTVTLFF